MHVGDGVTILPEPFFRKVLRGIALIVFLVGLSQYLIIILLEGALEELQKVPIYREVLLAELFNFLDSLINLFHLLLYLLFIMGLFFFQLALALPLPLHLLPRLLLGEVSLQELVTLFTELRLLRHESGGLVFEYQYLLIDDLLLAFLELYSV